MPDGGTPAAIIPRGLKRREAAAYCGLAPSTFDARVDEGLLRGPVILYRPRIWDRADLDRAMDRISFAEPAKHPRSALEPPQTFSEEVVYFVEAPSVGLIKIGWSTEFPRRLRLLRTSSPVELILLGYVPGGIDLERELHRQFDIERRHGEWFLASPRLRKFLFDYLPPRCFSRRP